MECVKEADFYHASVRFRKVYTSRGELNLFDTNRDEVKNNAPTYFTKQANSLRSGPTLSKRANSFEAGQLLAREAGGSIKPGAQAPG